MKCSRRSTTSFADGARLAAVLGLVLLGVSARAADEPAPPAVTAAILDAVRGEIGEGFAIEIVEVTSRLVVEPAALEALPAPGARLSRPMRFTLVERGEGRRSSRVRVGDAVATVRVIGPTLSWLWAIGITPARLTSPTVGLMPTIPQVAEGQTIEPSVSVPRAAAARLAETATPEPELEPQGLWPMR